MTNLVPEGIPTEIIEMKYVVAYREVENLRTESKTDFMNTIKLSFLPPPGRQVSQIQYHRRVINIGVIKL